MKFKDWYFVITLASVMMTMAGVSYWASRASNYTNDPVSAGEVHVLRPKKQIKIFLSGAVREEKELILEKGAKVQDLMLLDLYAENADLKKLNKKRKLKDLERIDVPCKKEPQKMQRKKSRPE